MNALFIPAHTTYVSPRILVHRSHSNSGDLHHEYALLYTIYATPRLQPLSISSFVSLMMPITYAPNQYIIIHPTKPQPPQKPKTQPPPQTTPCLIKKYHSPTTLPPKTATTTPTALNPLTSILKTGTEISIPRRTFNPFEESAVDVMIARVESRKGSRVAKTISVWILLSRGEIWGR